MNVLVAYDGSGGAEEALRFGARLAEGGGTLTVVHALNPHTDAADITAPSPSDAVAILRQRWEAELSARLAGMSNPTPTGIVEEHVRGEDTAECLLRVASEHNAEVLVIASKQATGWRGALGSVTQAVLGGAELPVTVVKA